jgi:hypothetical protein
MSFGGGLIIMRRKLIKYVYNYPLFFILLPMCILYFACSSDNSIINEPDDISDTLIDVRFLPDIIKGDVNPTDITNIDIDVEDIIDVSDIVDSNEDINDVGDVGFDAEDSGDALTDIEVPKECSKTIRDLDKNFITLTYKYYTEDNIQLGCYVTPDKIDAVVVEFKMTKDSSPLTVNQAHQKVDICFPKHDMCGYENVEESFPQGAKLQIHKIDKNNKTISLIVPRIEGYLDECGGIFGPPYLDIDNTQFACLTTDLRDTGVYVAFAGAYGDPHNSIDVRNGEVLCGNKNHCGKQYRTDYLKDGKIYNYVDENGKEHKIYLTTTWIRELTAKEGEVLIGKALYTCPNGVVDCDTNDKNVTIAGSEWKIDAIVIESNEQGDFLKRLVFRRK